ncbi:MAG: PA14 domain-containing protein [Verrucomicrobiota bacterium]
MLRDEIVSSTLINNDGVHSSQEKSETVYLPAGLHPVTIEWFNTQGLLDLSLELQGPGFSRKLIPDSMWFRPGATTGAGDQWVSGLNCFVFEGEWASLPDFSRLPVTKSNVVENISLNSRTRDDHVGLVFRGRLEIPQSGEYTLWLRSDDGSRLFLGDPLVITLRSEGKFPPAQPLRITSVDTETLNNRWVQVEGTVARVMETGLGVGMELSSDGLRVSLRFSRADYNSMRKLLNCHVRVSGVFQSAGDVTGQQAALLLVPDPAFVEIREATPMVWATYPLMPIKALTAMKSGPAIVHISGAVSSNRLDGYVVIQDGADFARIEASTNFLPGQRIELLGWHVSDGPAPVIRGALARSVPAKKTEAELPLLEKAIQVKSLSRAEAQRRYPAKIRGVVTARTGGDENFVIQDATWSVFCYWNNSLPQPPPKVGEEWEIEGTSDIHFAPDVRVVQAKYLRPGIVPDPIRPTRDELINGSLDTQFIEMQGIATALENDGITLWTREGKMRFSGWRVNQSEGLKNALVRVRGVFVPDRDPNQRMLTAPASFQLFNASVNVDKEAVADPFDTILKHPSDFRFYDAQADVLRRVKVVGQVVGGRAGNYFLMDGEEGLRFELQEPIALRPGDRAEVVGFPDVSGAAVVLREALIRITGTPAMPQPRRLEEPEMAEARLDSTLVTLESKLVRLGLDRSDMVMGLQFGDRSYLARFSNTNSELMRIQIGSRLELTGVYVALENASALGEKVDSFELQVDNVAGIRVLSRPPWWNLRHTLMVCGGLALILLLAAIWIALLRRQVEERTRQLAAEIKNRERVEYQRALEIERTRIAQDLHDELGASLTEMRFIGAIKSRDALLPGQTRSQFSELSEKARQMVSSLDEIVWAVNPANDSLPNLANYLCHLAEEFFRSTDMRCRLDVAQELLPVALTSEVRHHIYLVVREALNNIVKHSGANEVWLRIHATNANLEIAVEDNGRGFQADSGLGSGNGLKNMKARLAKIGGEFICESKPGFGTICRIRLGFSGPQA